MAEQDKEIQNLRKNVDILQSLLTCRNEEYMNICEQLYEKGKEVNKLNDKVAKLVGENEALKILNDTYVKRTNIVFCKDCKRWNRGYFQDYMCHSDVITGPNDFCSYGENKKEN